MDLEEPGIAFAGPLSMTVLRALDGRSIPATAAQVARTMEGGTQAGIKRALERLSYHGVCGSEELGGRTLYSLNYDHVLYPAIRAALDAPTALRKRLTGEFAAWEIEPDCALLFGSAARGDGHVESDIDILLIRPAMRPNVSRESWAPQVHELRSRVFRWTGNHAQILDWSKSFLKRAANNDEPLLSELRDDGVLLFGERPKELG